MIIHYLIFKFYNWEFFKISKISNIPLKTNQKYIKKDIICNFKRQKDI